jgi:hypothetical protein
MKVVCINDAGRPDDIPVTKWIKKDEEYTVIDVIVCKMQPRNPVALVLQEIDLTGCGFYKGFNSDRFRIIQLGPPEFAHENQREEGALA